MNFRFLCGTMGLVASLILFATQANATLTFYNDRTDWENALGGTITTEDFNGIAPFILGAGDNAVGQLNISILNPTGSFNRVGDISEFWNINGTTGYLGGGAESTTLELPQRIFGWGADFSSTHSAGGLTLEIDSIQAEFSVVLPDGGDLIGEGTGFLGVISTNAFSTIRLFDDLQNETFGMDNVSFGDGTFVATAISEPAAWAAFGLSLSLMGLARRRRARE